MSSEEKYFFEEHIRDFLNEKWEIAIQFPDDKILINQMNNFKLKMLNFLLKCQRIKEFFMEFFNQ